MAKFLSLLAGLLLVLTACGGGKIADGDFKDAKFETSEAFQNKGWYIIKDDDHYLAMINSDNYFVINGVPVALVFNSMQAIIDGDYVCKDWLSLEDASNAKAPHNPYFDEKMTSIGFMVNGKLHDLGNVAPKQNFVQLAEGDEAVALAKIMQEAKSVKFIVGTKDNQQLTFVFTPQGQEND